MKKTRFTEEQMITTLRKAHGKRAPKMATKLRISADDLRLAETFRLAQARRRESPSTAGVRKRPNKMVADRELEIDVLKEITRQNGSRTYAPPAGWVCTSRPRRVRLTGRGALDLG